VLFLLCCLIAAVASDAYAQTVVGDNNLVFGSLFRASSKSVAYASSDAARFTVSARKGRNLRLTVSKSLIYAGSVLLTAVVNISNSDCAFSLNNGSTWTTFSSGILYHNLTVPGSGGGNVSILVRVGGTVVAGLTQQRGDYSGTVTLTAAYY
jgi:hypothetical protein